MLLQQLLAGSTLQRSKLKITRSIMRKYLLHTAAAEVAYTIKQNDGPCRRIVAAHFPKISAKSTAAIPCNTDVGMCWY